MGLSTLLLIGAICSAEGPDKICTYVDVTERMEVVTDDQCFQIASIANADAVTRPDTPRYGCIRPEQYRALIGESEYLKFTRLPEQL